jgi:glycosyltransferase involved in cell wall biosynthesis
MKLLVFAHTPPPHHGQSYMVELMLQNFGGDRRGGRPGRPPAFAFECYHVNARFSKTLEDIGKFQGGKIFLILWYCLQAIWCRLRYGVTNFYYVPAPGKRVAVYRDWLILCLCRPFFKRTIFHWHAAGLAKWIETSVQIRTRSLNYHWFKQADLSIVISQYNVADAEKLRPRKIRIVSNGIPDPCADYVSAVRPRRLVRLAVRNQLLAGGTPAPAELAAAGDQPHTFKVLFLAHNTREKGLFAAAAGLALANAALAARNAPVRMKLYVAGSFVSAAEQDEFDRLRRAPEFSGTLEHLGFVFGPEKDRILRTADAFCFPTLYLGENQPVNLIEAMAYGLPIVTTRWRSLPEMFPPAYPGLVQNQAPEAIATALLTLLASPAGEQLRENFLNRFTLQHHLEHLAAALHELENNPAAPGRILTLAPD